ncbi:MAG: DNA-3-methyladenine glycosylase family protein [Solirubrobacteraceae bacterium]
MSKAPGPDRGPARAGVDRWAAGRALLRVADPRMAELVDAEPGLDPDRLFDRLPSDLWGALVLQVIGQQISLAAAAAILTRLEALKGRRMPTPAELLATDAETLRSVGMSRAKGVYLHDLAARLEDGRLDVDRLRTLDDDAARDALTEVKGVGRFTADGVLMLAMRRPDVWPAADLALRRAVERTWGLDPPASVEQVDALGERFRPWRTLAAAYVYASVE